MASTITHAEIELREIQLGRARHLDNLVDQIELLQQQTANFGALYIQPIPDAKPNYQAITVHLAAFQQHVAALATVEDERLSQLHLEPAISASIALRQEILAVGKLMRDHTASEEHATLAWFRGVVLALTLIFLVVLNIFVMVVLHMSNMVLKPVEKLVEGSRRLASEDFDYRVSVKPGDEFAELADAFNQLGQRLSANERRKLETLAQTAVMLNHELNNASAIIKLQLQLLERQSTGNAAFERALRQINESLARMTGTVEALKHVRRIVLTDYTPDTKMLDLEKSVAEEVAV